MFFNTTQCCRDAGGCNSISLFLFIYLFLDPTDGFYFWVALGAIGSSARVPYHIWLVFHSVTNTPMAEHLSLFLENTVLGWKVVRKIATSQHPWRMGSFIWTFAERIQNPEWGKGCHHIFFLPITAREKLCPGKIAFGKILSEILGQYFPAFSRIGTEFSLHMLVRIVSFYSCTVSNFTYLLFLPRQCFICFQAIRDSNFSWQS